MLQFGPSCSSVDVVHPSLVSRFSPRTPVDVRRILSERGSSWYALNSPKTTPGQYHFFRENFVRGNLATASELAAKCQVWISDCVAQWFGPDSHWLQWQPSADGTSQWSIVREMLFLIWTMYSSRKSELHGETGNKCGTHWNSWSPSELSSCYWDDRAGVGGKRFGRDSCFSSGLWVVSTTQTKELKCTFTFNMSASSSLTDTCVPRQANEQISEYFQSNVACAADFLQGGLPNKTFYRNCDLTVCAVQLEKEDLDNKRPIRPQVANFLGNLRETDGRFYINESSSYCKLFQYLPFRIRQNYADNDWKYIARVPGSRRDEASIGGSGYLGTVNQARKNIGVLMRLFEELADVGFKRFRNSTPWRGTKNQIPVADTTAERERIASVLTGSSDSTDYVGLLDSLRCFHIYGLYYETDPICNDSQLGYLFHSAVAMQFIAMAFVRTLSYAGFDDVRDGVHYNFNDAWKSCFQSHFGSVDEPLLPVPNNPPVLEFGPSGYSTDMSISSRVHSIIDGPYKNKNGNLYRCKIWTSHVVPVEPAPGDFEYKKLEPEDIPDHILTDFNAKLQDPAMASKLIPTERNLRSKQRGKQNKKKTSEDLQNGNDSPVSKKRQGKKKPTTRAKRVLALASWRALTPNKQQKVGKTIGKHLCNARGTKEEFTKFLASSKVCDCLH